MCNEIVARALYEKGEILEDFGEYKEAKKAFEASFNWFTYLLDSNTDSTLRNEWLCCRGFASLKSKNFDEAGNDFRDVLKTKPSDIKILRALALTYLEKESYDKAFEEINKAIDYSKEKGIKDPTLYKEWLCCRGFVSLRSKKLDEAKKDFENVLNIDKIDNSNIQSLRGLSLICLEKESYDKAFEEIDKAIDFNEKKEIGDPKLYKTKGNIFYLKGKCYEADDFFDFKEACYETALEWYEKSLDIDPKYVDAWINKAAALTKLEKYSKAIKAIENALYLDEDDRISWHNKGFILSQVGQYYRSLEARRIAIKLDPNNIDFLIGRATVYYKLKKYKSSLYYLDKALQLASNNAKINTEITEIWFFKSKIFYNLKRYPESLKSCENALKFSSKDDKIWNFKGFILYKTEKHSEALETFKQALINQTLKKNKQNDNKQNYKPYMNLGILYKEKFKDSKKAELYFEKAITILLKEIFPEDGIIIRKNTSILGKLEKYGHIAEQEIFSEDILLAKRNTSNFDKIYKNNIFKIIKKIYFEKPMNKILNTPKKDLLLIKRDIETYKRYSLKWCNISFILWELEKYELARKAAEGAISIDPENYLAWNGKGLSLQKLKKYDEALESFENSLKICPDFVEAHINRGILLKGVDIGKSLEAFTEAREILDAKLRENNKDADSLYHKGLVCYELDECESAIKAFDEVIQINQESIDAWNNKGLALYKLARYDDALQAFDKAMNLFSDKKNYDALNNKGLVLTDSNNYIESEKSFKKAMEPHKENFEAYNNLGRLCLFQEKVGEAHKYFSKAIELKKDSPEALLNRGLLLLYTGLYENSIDVLEKSPSLSQSSTCYLCKGIASLNLSRYEDTKTNLENAINMLEKRLKKNNDKRNNDKRNDDKRNDDKRNDDKRNDDKRNDDKRNDDKRNDDKRNDDERFLIKRLQINSILSHLLLGKLYLRNGSTKSALEEITQAKEFADKSQVIPPNLKGLLSYLRGKLCIENSEYKFATMYFQEALYKNPSERKFVLWKAYAQYMDIESSNHSKRKYQQEIVSIIRSLESTLSLSDELVHENFIDKLRMKISNFFLRTYKSFPSFYSKLPISTQMRLLESFYKRRKREEELLLIANTHYFLGCFYYKINDFYSSKDEFEKCYKLKPGGKLQNSSKNFLEIIMKYQAKPTWWQWWIYSPIDHKKKIILFFGLAVLVLSLTLLHPLMYPIIFRVFSSYTDVSLNVTSYGITYSQSFSPIYWTLYFIIVIICIFILLYPSIEYIRSKDVEIKVQSTQPLVDFYFPLCNPILSVIPSPGLEEMKKCPSLNQNPSHTQSYSRDEDFPR